MNKVIKSAYQYEQEIRELNKEIEQLKESNKLLADFRDFITEDMTETKNENKLMKKALRELLESNGNSYTIKLMNEIFNLNYYEWHNPTGYNSEDYINWVEVLNEKRKTI